MTNLMLSTVPYFNLRNTLYFIYNNIGIIKRYNPPNEITKLNFICPKQVNFSLDYIPVCEQ